MSRLIRRVPGTTPVATTESQVLIQKPPTRLLRFSSLKAQKTAEARRQAEKLLHLIAEKEQAIDEATDAISQAFAEIEALVREHKLGDVSAGTKTASIVEQMGRSSTHIDPKRFKAAVSDKDFWACVKVQVGEAEKVMSKKEFVQVADVTPAPSLGYVLKVFDKAKKGRK